MPTTRENFDFTPREEKLIAALRRCYDAMDDWARRGDPPPHRAKLAMQTAGVLLRTIEGKR